jgi:hypothetical protein
VEREGIPMGMVCDNGFIAVHWSLGSAGIIVI